MEWTIGVKKWKHKCVREAREAAALEAFVDLDVNHDGVLLQSELQYALQSTTGMSDEECTELFDLCNQHNDGEV